MRMIPLALIFLVVATAGCEKKPNDSAPSAGAAAAPKPGDNSAQEGQAHEGEGHGDQAGHELGTVTIGGFAVRVVQHGEVVAGKALHIDVHIPNAPPEVAAVRLWIGSEDGKGAMKTKATINKDEAHNHVETPSPLPADARLCVELELAAGQKKVGSLPLRR